VPYVQFESVGDFIPEPRCSKCAVGLQTKGSKMGGARGLVRLWTEGPRVTGAPTCAKCSNIYCSNRLCESILVVESFLLGESASPFIDEGDDLTSERECVLPSLIAHAVGYKMVCRCPQHCCRLEACGRLHRLLLVWQMSMPTIL